MPLAEVVPYPDITPHFESITYNFAQAQSSGAQVPHSYESNEERRERLHEILRKGEIPDDISEVTRMVPLESEQGRAFHQAMILFINTYAPGVYEFSASEPRLYLSANPGVNAFVIRPAHPALVGFHGALFDPQEAGGLDTIDARLGVIFHEGAHVFWGQDYDVINSSKKEEAAADIIAIRKLHEYGFDPRAYLGWMQKQLEITNEESFDDGNNEGNFNIDDAFKIIVDPHPSIEHRIAVAQAEITRIERES